MSTKDFEIYYYKDYYLSNVKVHTHSYYEFYFFLEGNISMEIGPKTFHLEPGDVVLVPPGVKHKIEIDNRENPYRRFVFWTSAEYMKKLTAQSSEYGYLAEYVKANGEYVFPMDKIEFNKLLSKVFRFMEEIQGDRFGRNAKTAICVNDLLFYINRVIYEKQHPQKEGEERKLYDQLVGYIEENLDGQLSLDELAEHFCVSKYHISHVFKDNLGISVHQYIMKKRIAACREAIQAGGKISEVYSLFGFGDYSSFFRAFRKEYGMSPKEFRDIGYLDTVRLNG